MVIKFIAVVVALIAAGYLAWWAWRFTPGLRARRMASFALKQTDWPPDLVEQLLEYARLLDPLSADFANICTRLAEKNVDDPRARALFERYLIAHNVTPQNAVVARRLAQLVPPEPAVERRAAEAGNAAALLDCLIQMELATDDDLRLRATFARLWTDVSPCAIAACLQARRLMPATPEADQLTRFLHDYFAAKWQDRHGLSDQARHDFLAGAAEVFCAMADLSPLDPLVTRHRAIQATFELGDYLTCFEQCTHLRNDFGPHPPYMDDSVWRMWGQCIVQLESQDWPAFGQGRFAHLPTGTSWSRLQEILDHAAALEPDDAQLLHAQAWAYLGAKMPVARALPVYERVLDKHVPIVPVLEQLVDYYCQTHAWTRLERACRELLPLQKKKAAACTARCLAQALIEGNLAPDIALFERVFDDDPAYSDLNGRLAAYYLQKPSLTRRELARVERLLDSPLPAAFSEQLVALREKFALAWIESGEAVPPSLPTHINHYLESGGANLRLMQWAIEHNVGSAERQMAVLETLVRQRPVERRYCLQLADRYAAIHASDEQIALLAQAAESDWQMRNSFDEDDCRLATFIGRRAQLAPTTRRKLLEALLQKRPVGERRATAIQHLTEALRQGQADSNLLRLVLDRLYRPDERDPLHVWALEALAAAGDETTQDELRRLALYDSGVACPDESEEEAHRKGEALAASLATRCRKARRQARAEMFEPLLRRIMSKDVTSLADWEIDLFVWGLDGNLVPRRVEHLHFAAQVADVLAARGEARAVAVQRWVYEDGGRKPSDAAHLFEMAHRLQQVKAGEPFWFEVARLAQTQADVAGLAHEFLASELLARETWDTEHIEVACKLLESPYRQHLAPTFVERVEYGRDAQLDRRLLELVDESPERGRGHARLLWDLAEQRERQRNYNGALEAYLLFEESEGSSEELTRRILNILPSSPHRARYADRLAEYLELYPESFDLVGAMVRLARDESRPLSFELAFKIVDHWAQIAVKQEGSHSFIAGVKCELYDHYRDAMTHQDARRVLSSIARHCREDLEEQVRQHIERIGDEVLHASAQDDETLDIVAGMLAGLGKLAAATWHYERLVESSAYRQIAVKSLETIIRRLEPLRRELPALLTAYRYVAQDAYNAGQLNPAEGIIKKAKSILLDEAALEALSEEERKRIAAQRDGVLRLYERILEEREKSGQLTDEQTHDRADVYRLRGLWEKAGKLYTGLALSCYRRGAHDSALRYAELVFDCYYKAGKRYWEQAASDLLVIIWGQSASPSRDVARQFDPRRWHLMEYSALLYHALALDTSTDYAERRRFREEALKLYRALPTEYTLERDYIGRLHRDIQQATPTIPDPFELVPHIHERGRAEMWTHVRYEKQDRLGDGEFAEVYKVVDVTDQDRREYAMKWLKAAKGRDPKTVERFQREAGWLKEMDHPNIVKCYDAGVEDGRPYIIMDYVEGETLDNLIVRRRDIPIQQRLRIFLNVCSAVEFLHNQGILHRDLHPGNVLVGRDLQEVKLSDFGLATMMDREGIGKSSRIHGRQDYTPPEVGKQGETIASDIYSLGVMLCFILSCHSRRDDTLLRDLKSPEYFGLGEVIERATRNDPAARYHRVTELIQEIRRRANLPYDYGAILQKVTPLRFGQMFELIQEIGKGKAGPVYRARDRRTPDAPDVAIKQVTDEQAKGRLASRAEQFFRVRDLSHANIVQLQAFFRVNGALYVVMDLVEGRSLADWLEDYEKKSLRFLPAQVLSIMHDLASGLAFVHQHNIVHSCVVPTNILLEDATRRTKLSDFTASVLFDGDHWRKSAALREYDYYLAPEIEQDKPTPASDVYSLGCLLGHMVTGQRGHVGLKDFSTALDQVGQWSESQIEHLTQIFENSTRVEPAQRAFQDAGAFLKALQDVWRPE